MAARNEKYVLKVNASKHPHEVKIWAVGLALEKDEWVWNKGSTFIVQSAHICDAENEPVGDPPEGGVQGPGSSVAGNIAAFAGTAGKEIEDSGVAITSLTNASSLLTGTLDGNLLPAASTSKKGGAPVLSNVVTEFLNGQGGWSVPSAGGAVFRPYVTVGLNAGCDYVTDGVNDQVQVNAALAANHYVIPYTDLHIGAPIDYGAYSDRVLDGFAGGRGATSGRTIFVDANNINAVNLSTTGACNVLKNLCIKPNTGVTMAAGTYAINVANSLCQIDNVCSDLMMHSLYIGAGGVLTKVSNSYFHDIHGYGALIYGSDCVLDDVVMWGQTTGATNGIFASGVGNLQIDNCNIMCCGSNLYLRNCMSAKVHQSFFDQGTGWNVVEAQTASVCRHIDLIDCWFAGQTWTTPVGVGLLLVQGPGNIYDVNVIGGQMRDAYSNAILLQLAAKHVKIDGVHFTNMGRNALGSCVNLGGSSQHVKVTGCDYNEDTYVYNVGAVYSDASIDYIIPTGNGAGCASAAGGGAPSGR